MNQNVNKDTQNRLKKQPPQSQDNISQKNREQRSSHGSRSPQQSAQNPDQRQQQQQQGSSRDE